ncbi:MAG: cupredoxin domain-containing protein [Burkholderiales bacterium]|nr:cupredoxin domain-containing protein [Burkholderiales bacterium]
MTSIFRRTILTAASFALVGAFATTTPIAHAADLPVFNLSVKDGYFTPNKIEVPANTKFKIAFKNEGTGPEEFESSELHIEKVLSPGASSFIVIQPLKAGSYKFVGEFHPKTALGVIVAK